MGGGQRTEQERKIKRSCFRRGCCVVHHLLRSWLLLPASCAAGHPSSLGRKTFEIRYPPGVPKEGDIRRNNPCDKFSIISREIGQKFTILMLEEKPDVIGLLNEASDGFVEKRPNAHPALQPRNSCARLSYDSIQNVHTLIYSMAYSEILGRVNVLRCWR